MQLHFNDKKLWNHLEEYLCACLFGIMLIMLFTQVVLRFLFHLSSPVLEEYSLYMFVWFVFLASSNAILRNEHIRIEVITTRLPEKAQAGLYLVMMVINIGYSAVVMYAGWFKVMDQYLLGTVSATTFPLFIMSLALPVGMFASIVRSLQNIYLTIKLDFIKKERGDV